MSSDFCFVADAFPHSGHKSAVTNVTFSADGRVLASSSVDGEIRLWDLAAGREFATIRAHSSMVGQTIVLSFIMCGR